MIEAEIDRGVFCDRSEAERTTVAELIERYLREVTPPKKSASREKQRLNAGEGYFEVYSCAALRGSHVAEYRDAGQGRTRWRDCCEGVELAFTPARRRGQGFWHSHSGERR